jgi:phospholipid transport system substrate-binding protein
MEANMARSGWLVPLVVLALAGAAASPLAAAEPETSPAQAAKFIQDIGDRAVTLLARYGDGDAHRLQLELQTLIHDGFDLDTISRFALGTAWQTATPAQRQEYQSLFAAWTADTYARRLGGDKGGSLTVLGAHRGSEERGSTMADAIVQTRINRADGTSIDADLRVRGTAGRMKIVDVSMGGVSMDMTQRDEFAAVIRREGVSGLISELKTHVSSLNEDQQAARR